jgi:hypothetical protein
LAETAIKALISRAVTDFAGPAIDSVVARLQAKMGMPTESGKPEVQMLLAGRINRDWIRDHGGLVYPCSGGSQQDCIDEAVSEANRRAREYGAGFLMTYQRCQERVVLGGHGDFVQSVGDIGGCAKSSGYYEEMVAIINASGRQP